MPTIWHWRYIVLTCLRVIGHTSAVKSAQQHVQWSIMAAELQETIALLRRHLELAGIRDESQQVWTLAPSPLGGRGVLATRDIQAGELIFYDVPLVLGPRAGVFCPPVCAGCHEGSKDLAPCSRGCGLPVCSVQCESVARHQHECEKLRNWGVHKGEKTWSSELLRALTPVRCLALSQLQRRVLECLQSHEGSQHAFEVNNLNFFFLNFFFYSLLFRDALT